MVREAYLFLCLERPFLGVTPGAEFLVDCARLTIWHCAKESGRVMTKIIYVDPGNAAQTVDLHRDADESEPPGDTASE